MPTEKLNNVDALKIGEDDNNNDAEGVHVKHAKIWTGIIKEEPGKKYFHPIPGHPYGGEEREIFLLQIQPTNLKDTVWGTGGFWHRPDLSSKGTRVQFQLDPIPGLKFQDPNGFVLAESRLGTIASAVHFERVLRDQDVVIEGIPRTTGTVHRNSKWRRHMSYE